MPGALEMWREDLSQVGQEMMKVHPELAEASGFAPERHLSEIERLGKDTRVSRPDMSRGPAYLQVWMKSSAAPSCRAWNRP